VRKPPSVRIRDVIISILSDHGISSVDENDPLFSSGRLDSLAATQVLIFLETEYGVDLADEDFDISQIDTIHNLETFVSSRATAHGAVERPDR